ncbi:hypothetical protein ACIBP4_01135 [Micromonospora maritima]|uniref:Uncharacterized protein n=1 Tax=Micromonospora maritima TaxID=986711 RepID=A0ABW7ZDH6_9ACTN
MTETGPIHPADWHARRAEELAELACSASMAGLLKRGRRRELLAAAEVHAILGASAVPSGDHVERLAIAEAEASAARAQAADLAEQLDGVERALRDYGQDLLVDGRTSAEAVEALMGRVFNDEPLEDRR